MQLRPKEIHCAFQVRITPLTKTFLDREVYREDSERPYIKVYDEDWIFNSESNTPAIKSDKEVREKYERIQPEKIIINNMSFTELVEYSKNTLIKSIKYDKSLKNIIIELLFNGIIWSEARYKHEKLNYSHS